MNKNKKINPYTLTNIAQIRPLARLALIFFTVITPIQTVYSADNTLCSPPVATVKGSFSADGKTHLQANKVELIEEKTSLFIGDVVLQQADKRVESDQAKYEKPTEEVFVQGNVKFVTPSMQVKSKTAHINLKTNDTLLEQTEFQSVTGQGRGQAKSIKIENTNITKLNDATYTTCEPENVDWLLKANSITLNHESRQGSASHAVLRFKDVPFFYFPYIRFPLGDARLSGFLFPYIGKSKTNGFELKLPYYWNIHPQIDATITPWFMEERGTLLHAEFRYLTKNNEGKLTSESLNNDKIFKSDRQLWHWKHEPLPSLGWQTKAEYNYIADDQHLIDFSENLTSSSTSSLVRTGEVSYNTDRWVTKLKAEDYLVLSGAEPYKRLPQLTLNSRFPTQDNKLNYAFQSEAVQFDHENNKVIGQRIHLNPSVSLPMVIAAGHLIPKISLNHTEYNLQQTSGKTKLSRTVPTLSLNGALFFERDTQFFDSHYLNTLEPQLFYVYTPFSDQSDFPIFDTSVRSFDVNNFTTDNRFNSIDRIGDDNRITTALATRFINHENGHELIMARIGQIHYFSDRKIHLGNSIDKSTSSNIITETQFSPDNWKLSSQITWDSEFKQQLSASNQLNYQNSKFSANLAHRLQLNALETNEIKMNWTLNSRWQFNFTNLYDIQNDHVIESLLGVNYESCCWALNFSAKDRYISPTQTDTGVFIELTLKGLGGFGVRGEGILKTLNRAQDL